MVEKEGHPRRAGLSGAPLAVAVVAVCIWIAFVLVMLLSSDTPDLQWTRLTFVFSSVEAVAFAAAGALFGVTVQRDRVERAEKQADSNAKDAANGRALAAMTMADDDGAPGQKNEPPFPEESYGVEGPVASEESYGVAGQPDRETRRRHADAARRLFPDL
ncbi:MAG TPA: hypothetical protein VIW24_17510 [Aldersonia sp.]